MDVMSENQVNFRRHGIVVYFHSVILSFKHSHEPKSFNKDSFEVKAISYTFKLMDLI